MNLMKHWQSRIFKTKKVFNTVNDSENGALGNESAPQKRKDIGDVFGYDQALAINQARMNHLQTLGLPLDKQRVLDVGCGHGYLSSFFVKQQCKIAGVDGRSANIDKFKSLHPTSEAYVLDVETHPLLPLGQFDVVFCYGLLYHVENPGAVLQNMGSVCRGILLLETIICDSKLPIVLYKYEQMEENQALHGMGCRPAPSYIVMKLRHIGFPWIYRPVHPPNHSEFQFSWKNNLDSQRQGKNLRCVFVASRNQLINSTLVPFSEVQ